MDIKKIDPAWKTSFFYISSPFLYFFRHLFSTHFLSPFTCFPYPWSSLFYMYSSPTHLFERFSQ